MNIQMEQFLLFAMLALSTVSTLTSANPLCGGKAGCQTASVGNKAIDVGHTDMEGARKAFEARATGSGSITANTGSGKTMGVSKGGNGQTQANADGKAVKTMQDSDGIYNAQAQSGKAAQAKVEEKTSFDVRTKSGKTASAKVDPSNSNQYNIGAKGDEQFTGQVQKNDGLVYAKNTADDESIVKANGIKKGSKAVSAVGKKDGKALLQMSDGKAVDSGKAIFNKPKTNIFGKTVMSKSIYQADVAEKGTVSKFQLQKSARSGRLSPTRRGLSDSAKNEVAILPKSGNRKLASLTLISAEELQCDHLKTNLIDDNGFKWFNESTNVEVEANENGEYTWPACMIITTTVQIPSGIKLDDMAASLTVLIPNCGEMKCDGKQCHGLQCFYDDFCEIKPQEDPVLAKSQIVEACDGQMVMNRARNETVQFRFCPNVEHSAEDDRKACASTDIFDTVRSSLEIQMNLYTYKNEQNRGCDLAGRLNIEQRACRRVRVAYSLKAFGKDYSASINRFDAIKRKLQQKTGMGPTGLGNSPIRALG